MLGIILSFNPIYIPVIITLICLIFCIIDLRNSCKNDWMSNLNGLFSFVWWLLGIILTWAGFFGIMYFVK